MRKASEVKSSARIPITIKRKETWKDEAEAYLVDCRANGLAEYTMRDVELHIGHLFETFGAVQGDEESERKALLAYIAHSSTGKTQLAPATRNRRLTYLRRYYGWLRETGRRPEGYDPTAGIKKLKEDEKTATITDTECQRVIDAFAKKCDEGEGGTGTTWNNYRNYVMVLTLATTGIRPGELRKLKPENVRLAEGFIEVPANVSKTHVARTVGIAETLKPHLMTLLALHTRLSGEGLKDVQGRTTKFPADATVFCTSVGNTLSASAWINIWRRTTDLVSPTLGRKVQSYDFRHHFGTVLAKQGNTKILMLAMGHTNPKTTMRYIHPTAQEIAVATTSAAESFLSKGTGRRTAIKKCKRILSKQA